jgi:23S rRNA (adenine2503-C2)-methyltransferase
MILNDLSPERFEALLRERAGASAAEARKLFAAVHARTSRSLWRGEGPEALAHVGAVRRSVLDRLGEAELPRLRQIGQEAGADGFVRYLFECPDGARVEAVRIPIPCEAPGAGIPERLRERPHYVVCLSSQVGCALACAFCQTGRMGFTRNLEVWEIVEQLRLVRAKADRPVRGAVFMGMGEPMLNYDRVIAAARIFSAPAGYAIAADRITLSTAGVVPGIRRFTEERQPYRLAVSLTAASSAKRLSVMPIEGTWPLPELIAAVREHQATRGGRAMLAWVAIDGFNVGKEDARQLAELIGDLPIRLDLIDVADPSGRFRPPGAEALSDFRTALAALKQPVARRYSGGRDVNAGCGMLAATPLGPQT